MINKEIKFPILELTDWVFDGEKVLEADFEWDGIHYIKEKDLERQYQRVLIDSNGRVLKVAGKKLIRKKGQLLSFVIQPTLVVEFDLVLTDRTMSLEDVKRKILSRSSENYHITHNRLIKSWIIVAKSRHLKHMKNFLKSQHLWMKNKKPTANNIDLQAGVSCFVGQELLIWSAVLRRNFSGEKPLSPDSCKPWIKS